MFKDVVQWLRRRLVEFNLYRSDTDDPIKIHRQRLATRLFVVLITISTLVLLFYTGFTLRKTTVTIAQPTQRQFETLWKRFPTTLQCPCKQISIPYRSFTAIDVSYHDVCSSAFVTPEWIRSIDTTTVSYHLSAFWQTVAALCQNSEKSLSNAINSFKSTNMITPQIMPVEALKTRVAASLDFEVRTTQAMLHRTLLTIRQMISGNQIVSGLGTNAGLHVFDVAHEFASSIYPRIRSYGNCSCLNMEGCRRPFNTSAFGLFVDCYPVDATLASSLQCYFSSNCSNRLHPTTPFLQLSESHLVRHQINTTVETLFNDLFVEDLSKRVLFGNYYVQCSPSSCIYIFERRFDVLFMFSTIIGVIGGLVAVLKFISPLLVKLACRIRAKIGTPATATTRVDHAMQNGSILGESVLGTKIIRFFKSLPRKAYDALINLNVFNTYSNERHVIRRQRISTRLYYLSLVTLLTCLVIYNLVAIQVQTIIVENPSESEYTALYSNHSNSLECQCSQISVPFDDFIHMRPVMHEVCASQFVSPEWYRLFINVNVTPSEIHEHFPYIAASYFQLLASFCSLAQYSINDSLRLFGARLYINDKVLPHWQFVQQTQAFIDTFTNTTKNEFIRIFALVRNATTGNQYVTGPSLNGRLIVRSDRTVSRQTRNWYELDIANPSEGISICKCTRGGPRCGFFIRRPTDLPTDRTYLTGQYIGCLVMDGLLISSLECWYDRSCVDKLSRWLVEEGVNHRFDITPLDADSPSRFTTNTSMNDLINELLLESWMIDVSYEKFYRQCAPQSCTYTIRGRYDLVYAILLIIAIYGGLSKALQIIVPNLVRLVFLALYWKRQRVSK